jgi:phospholipid/cholesterol/gamma-HCH transport system permease protein
VLPRVVALAVALPLLVVWTDVMALWGGILASELELDIGFAQFFERLPQVVPAVNLWIGVAKGAVFGALIGLVACHYGLRVEPNTESVGSGTTSSVVAAITLVLVADAVFAIALSGVGLEGTLQ